MDYSRFKGLTNKEIQQLNKIELVNWPILSEPFTNEDIKRFSETEFKKLLWLVRTLLEIHSDIDDRSSNGEPEPDPNYSLPIDLKKFGYGEATGLASSMAGVELEQCLSELKRREYIPSYGIGLDGADRVLYIGWSAHIVALTELYDSLLVRWKLNLAGKKSKQSVTSENFNECLINNFRGGRRVMMKMLIQKAEIWRNGSQVDKGEGVNRFELEKAGKYNSERAFRESLQDMRKGLSEYRDTKVEIQSDTTNHYLLKITF